MFYTVIKLSPLCSNPGNRNSELMTSEQFIYAKHTDTQNARVYKYVHIIFIEEEDIGIYPSLIMKNNHFKLVL